MTAAIFAAREGAQVVLLEHKDRVGKKILSTGNGRCNLSNRLQEPFCYRSGQPDFPWKALACPEYGYRYPSRSRVKTPRPSKYSSVIGSVNAPSAFHGQSG